MTMIQTLTPAALTAKQILPLDPSIRKETLPNGLISMIRANRMPELLRTAAAHLDPRSYALVVLYPEGAQN